MTWPIMLGPCSAAPGSWFSTLLIPCSARVMAQLQTREATVRVKSPLLFWRLCLRDRAMYSNKDHQGLASFCHPQEMPTQASLSHPATRLADHGGDDHQDRTDSGSEHGTACRGCRAGRCPGAHQDLQALLDPAGVRARADPRARDLKALGIRRLRRVLLERAAPS